MLEWARSKTLMRTYVEEDVGKGNTAQLLMEVQTSTSDLEISMVISQKNREQPSSRTRNTTFGYIHKGYSIIPPVNNLTAH